MTGKESNRATTIQSEWANVGIRVDLDEATDTMTIHPAPIQAGRIETYGDYRLAMAAALAQRRTRGNRGGRMRGQKLSRLF